MTRDRSTYERKASYYDQYAPYFETVAPALDTEKGPSEERELEFYVEQARAANGPVLEIGCGRGRVYLELLQAGVDAYAIDLSTGMLRRLRERAAELGVEPAVRKEAMQTFTPQREYGAVFLPGRVFIHALSRAEQRRTLENAYEALVPGGTFVCDFYPMDLVAVAERSGTEREVTFEHEGERHAMRASEEIVDRVHNVVCGSRTIENADGTVVAEMTTEVKLVTKDEFASLLELVGFTDWELYGDYESNPHESVEQKLIWVADR